MQAGKDGIGRKKAQRNAKIQPAHKESRKQGSQGAEIEVESPSLGTSYFF
jgi:hypothetical protein